MAKEGRRGGQGLAAGQNRKGDHDAWRPFFRNAVYTTASNRRLTDRCRPVIISPNQGRG